MIGIDWGTTSFRAFRMNPDGTIRDRAVSANGIMNVLNSRFAETLREEIGPWLAAGEDHVLISGMIGSRQGWAEVPYLPCPATPADIAAAVLEVGFDWGQVLLVPGLSGTDESGIAEVMRGEETQIAGIPALLDSGGVACLLGTHSKWARIENGQIVQFTTHMTGEIFAALRGHTILGRMMRDGPAVDEAFDRGVARSDDPGGLLHHAFGVRAETLANRLPETEAASYLSGILIGHEIRSALGSSAPGTVHLIGTPDLTRLYARAIATVGGGSELHGDEAAAQGLALIGRFAPWR
jgi:2-dehydro-3-deoxygalactonokinase